MDNKRTTSLMMRVKKWLNKNKNSVWIPVIGVCGVLLIGVSALFDGSDSKETAATVFDTTVYAKALEERLEKMVASIDGAGKTSVMVTLENGIEYVYADEQKSNSDRVEQQGNVEVSDDSQRTVVTVDAADGKTGLLVTEIQPTIRGVVVACVGARDETVAAMVTAAVRTALDISEKRVCVIPYTSEGELLYEE